MIILIFFGKCQKFDFAVNFKQKIEKKKQIFKKIYGRFTSFLKQKRNDNLFPQTKN
jgi:hypothetical protein